MERGIRFQRRVGIALACAVVLGGTSAASAQGPRFAPPANAPAAVPDFEPGRVIVRYRPGAGVEERRETRRDVEATSARALDLARTELLRLPPGDSVAAAVSELRGQPDVEFAQPDYLYRLEAAPNDPAFSQQWGLSNSGQVVGGTPGTPDGDIDGPEAWDVTTGSDGVIVGVIDSGVNVQHPDLAPNVFVNQAEQNGAPGVDDDGNGAPDDVNGFDFVNGNGNVSDDREEHGTLVASVIGARGGNALGVTGVAQRVRILPLQARSASGGVSTSAAVNAVAYARAMGARVINMSFGSFGPPDGGDLAIRGAVEASPGVLFSTSSGNQDPDTGLANNNDVKPHWPSNLTVDHANVIATANTTNTDALSGSSSFGAASVDLAAPGTGILGARVTDSFFAENFDDDTAGTALPTGWTEVGTNWAVTAEAASSPPNSLTDSPGADYAANSSTSATTPDIAVPAGTSFCKVQHGRLVDTEEGFDFLRIAVSIGGGPFTQIETQSGSANEFADPDFTVTGPNTVKVRFLLTSDALDERDGAYIDDVAVRCGPTGELYRSASGTSFSAPMTAGVAALMLAHNPGLVPAGLKAALRANVDVVPGLAGRVSTGGRLNADKAVRAVTPPPPPPPRDLQAAIVRGVSLLPATFLPLRAGATVRSTALRRGSRLRFIVNEVVRVRVQIYARKPGRRVGRRCLLPTRARRRRSRCTRFLSRGVYSVPGRLNGLIRRTLSGRLRGRALRPGPYRLTIRATDLAGNRSRPANKNFRIAKAPRPRRRR